MNSQAPAAVKVVKVILVKMIFVFVKWAHYNINIIYIIVEVFLT